MSAAQETVVIDDIYRDPTTEHWLDGWGVSYYMTSVSVAQIDFTASRRYQNRGGATTSDEQVDAIATMMQDPAYAIQPIVVTAARNGSLLIIDGNHRGLAAVKADRANLYAYVVATDGLTLDRMALAANARNALHVTAEMRDRLIVAAVAGGMSRAAAGREWGLSGDRVSAIVRQHSGREALHGIGVNVAAVSAVTAEIVTQLDREHLTAIGAKALTLATSEEVRAMAQQIKKAPPTQQVAVAREAGEKLLRRKADAKTPAAKRKAAAGGMSATRVVNALAKVTAAIQQTPQLGNDPKVKAALDSLVKVARP